MRNFYLLRAFLENHDFEEKTFSKKHDSMILNEKVFVKSLILNQKFFVLSDLVSTFFQRVGIPIE